MVWIFSAQIAIPLALIAWLACLPPKNTFGFWVQVFATALALFAVLLSGIWLFPPWWMPYLFALLLFAAIISAWRRNEAKSFLPQNFLSWASTVLFMGLGIYSAHGATQSIAATAPPSGEVVDLAFPFAKGQFLIANGGNDIRINSHLESMISPDPRFKPWRGNGHAIDIVAINSWGMRTSGFMPQDPSAYYIYGMAVLAPCPGRILLAVDGLPDMPVPEYDRAHIAGNHVLVACGDKHVLVAHFRKGSVVVKVGDQVEAGQKLAEAGNSGGSNEPHLHIHAQKPGSFEAPYSGDPIPARFNGRYLVRNDRISVP
jgi:hypothetical protein